MCSPAPQAEEKTKQIPKGRPTDAQKNDGAPTTASKCFQIYGPRVNGKPTKNGGGLSRGAHHDRTAYYLSQQIKRVGKVAECTLNQRHDAQLVHGPRQQGQAIRKNAVSRAKFNGGQHAPLVNGADLQCVGKKTKEPMEASLSARRGRCPAKTLRRWTR